MKSPLAAVLVGFALLTAVAAHALDPAPTVSVVFAGDIVLDDDAGELIARGGDPFAGFATLFRSADIRLGNLECVIATTGSAGDKNFTFRAHPRVLPTLKLHFDAVALANNHSGDYGRVAFAEMLDHLQQAGLAQFGGGRNLREAHTPLVLERKGIRIAFLGYNEFMPRSFTADFNAPGSAWSEDEYVRDDIRAARTVHRADIVIPVMHWGWENEPQANARQRQLAHLMIHAGADAVLGGHPHVTQNIEVFQGKPILYSVGNFVMKETDNDNQRKAWIARLQVKKSGVMGFDTHAVNIGMDGIPAPAHDVPTPCWSQRDTQSKLCKPGR
jgi:poly-gamma-glutamate synthesis protein (capsule biosynthesis protein)